jgi:hypothetical protein
MSLPGTHLGLTDVAVVDLEKALRTLHHGDLDVPVSPIGLARVGLQHCAAPLMHVLRDLDKRGIHAVLVAVIAERKRFTPVV